MQKSIPHCETIIVVFYVIGLNVAQCCTCTSLGQNFAASWWLSVSRDSRYILSSFVLLVAELGFALVAKISMCCVYVHKQTKQNWPLVSFN